MTTPHQAFFLTAGSPSSGDLFCIYRPPLTSTVRGAVVYVHPFAEELNKARRMAALQARMLANAGYAVLQLDLTGCGDSAGDFVEATWSGWISDVTRAAAWLQRRHAAVPFWYWGLRTGCLLAVAAARNLPHDHSPNFLFWQAVTNGRASLQQFLRLKSAADMLKGNAGGGIGALRQRLNEGSPVEVAGYQLSSDVALGLEGATLVPERASGQLIWLETSTNDVPTVSPASGQALSAWQQAGYRSQSSAVSGPAFWLSTEVEIAPALLDATVAAMVEASERGFNQ